MTPVIIGSSFLYMPSLLARGTMLIQFLDLTSTFVIPLLTLYLMGTLTRVHRSSGTIGLLVGAAYGVLRWSAAGIAETWGIAVLPPLMVDTYAAYACAMLVTAGTMVIVSLVRGWEPRGASLEDRHEERGEWLRSSQLAVRSLESGETGAPRGPASILPAVLALLVVALGCYLSFVVFW